jgi:nitroreductase
MGHSGDDILKIIHTRKSIRNYTNKPVPDETIEIMLRAAMAAPSARNVQPWRFYIITNRIMLNDLSITLPYAKMLESAPLAIVIAGDLLKGSPNQEQIHNWVIDCAAATQNLLLAAEALGLGAVWTGVYPYQSRVDAVSKALSLPAHIIPLNIIPIGYPAKQELPKNKWDPGKIEWVN